MKNKIYLSLSFALLFFAQSFSQSVTVQVRGDDLYYSEPGCYDCWGPPNFYPDPTWGINITTPSGPYNWSVHRDEYPCGWSGITNATWVAPQTQLATATLTVSMDGREVDGGICGADDAVCGGYQTVGTVVINSNPPCQWNSFNYQRSCTSDGTTGTYAVKWSYYWFYQTILPGTIVGADTICSGGDPAIFTNGTSGTASVTYQWQYSDDNGITWIDIAGATGLTYDPPAGLTNTRWYRRKASSCGGVPDVFTNIVKAIVNPNPVATAAPTSQTLCSGDSTSIHLTSSLTGTTFAWTVIQTSSLGASPGSDSSIVQGLSTTGITIDTAIYTIIPKTGLCVGTPITAKAIVDPIPSATATPNSQIFCSGGTTSIALTSNVPGTTFSWTVFLSGVTGATLGSGPLIAQTLTTTGNNTGTAVYTITPLANGCLGNPFSVTITVNPSDNASFTYTSATYCQSGANPTPTITGLPGGIFSSTPAGLSINPATGTINLSASTLGSYNLYYKTNGTCPDSSSITMTIDNTTPSASFSYSGSPFCQNGVNPLPVFISGSSAGIFSASPSGLVFIHVNTGQINLSASAPGTYTVTNFIPASGTCGAASAVFTITINASDNASFTYPSATYCKSGPNATPTITGLPGGTFSAIPTGLSIDSLTGTITLSTSTLGAYILSYKTHGACPNTSSITMTITNTTPSAGFSYLGSPYCQSGTNPNPLFVIGASAGIFSATPSGLVFVHVNTGQINLAASAPGTYIVTNTIPASGTCGAASATYTITINTTDNASFIYSSATYCQSGTNPTPVVTGLPGGTFSSTPFGLILNPSTGMITLSTSAIGAYTLSYTTNGACPSTSSITMTIGNITPSASFSYTGSSYCQNGINPIPIFGPGASAGIFSATPSGLTFVNVNTGQVDLSASAPGTYTITNTIPASGTCGVATAITTFTINASDNASFVYSSATYCRTGTNPTPTITGLPGGIFSATPSGLSINPVTGGINLATSSLGVYTLSYTTNGICPNTSSITMTITNTTPSANFSYSGSPFCQNATNPFPTFGIGASPGTFSASPIGLVFIHVNTGQINIAGSSPGTYIVTNTIPASGSCGAASATYTIIINATDNASFLYSSATYCQSGSNPTPTITGIPGGLFLSVPPGLSINPATGTINLSASVLGAYTLSYTTNGICPNTSSITMTIDNTTPSAVFSYSASSYCQNAINPFPIFGAGASAGIFSTIPTGLVFINANTGEINLSASAAGTYTVTNTIPASGTCGAVVATTTVIINASDNASFTYPSATYCRSGIDPTPSITGLPGGTFSSSPVGLVLNPTTGLIGLAASALGSYTLTYSTYGPCPNTSSITMTISDTVPSSHFSYSGSPFCQNASNPFPTFGPGASAGIFSSSPFGLVFVNVNTGAINLSLSTAGTYTVTNTIPASGTCLVATAISTVIINPSPIVTATPSAPNICTGATTSILLTSSIPGTTYAWTVLQTGVSGASAGSGSSIAQTLTLIGSCPGTAIYTITSNAGICSGTPIIVVVTVHPLPVANTSSVIITPANCGGPSGGVSGVIVTSCPTTTFQYAWKDSAGNVVGNNADLSNVVPGHYTLTATDPYGCSVSGGTYTVPPTPPVVAVFTPNPITGETPLTVNFTNNSTGATHYSWQFGTGDTSTVMNPSYIYKPRGTFTVCLTAISGTGCIDTACALINIYLNSVLIIPNIFTPNDDNVNDIYTVVGVGLKTVDAEIYNRWGEKLYEWHTVLGGWNGRTASGVPASAGTYYYIIKATGIDDKTYSEKGFFNLVR